MLLDSISANQALKKEGITGEELAKKNTKNGVQEMARDRYWYPQMSNTELAYVRRIAKYELTKTDNYLDEDNKWLYNVKNGNAYFALYSIADVNEPTILYACKGKRAEIEHQFLIEQFGDEVDNDGSINKRAESIDKLLSSYGYVISGQNVSNRNVVGGRSNNRNATPHIKNTRIRPSEALLNCLRNIREIQKRNKRNRLEQYSDRDTLGNTLTEAQQSYFAESKVRDENGNLKVMYHGSPNADFTIFKSGTYFTEHKWYADVYQNQGASSLSYKKTANKPDTYAV